MFPKDKQEPAVDEDWLTVGFQTPEEITRDFKKCSLKENYCMISIIEYKNQNETGKEDMRLFPES